jgi:hypothetical protein
MYDLSKLDPAFDDAQREAILAEARAWYTRHTQVKRFLPRDSREQNLFPMPDSPEIMRDTFLSGQTARSNTKEAPCTQPS